MKKANRTYNSSLKCQRKMCKGENSMVVHYLFSENDDRADDLNMV